MFTSVVWAVDGEAPCLELSVFKKRAGGCWPLLNRKFNASRMTSDYGSLPMQADCVIDWQGWTEMIRVTR